MLCRLVSLRPELRANGATGHRNNSGSFRSRQLVLSHVATRWTHSASHVLALFGHAFTHALHRMHALWSVITVSLTAMAAVEHATEHAWHKVQSADAVAGAISDGSLCSR